MTTIEYFCDVMPMYELDDIIDNLQYCDTIGWEQARLIAWLISKANFKNIKKIEDFLPLPTDKGMAEHEKPKPMTKEDIERLKNLAQRLT